jgi:hypothetical protein
MTALPSSVVLIGVGEMGGVFAKALLRAGHPVVPVPRSVSMDDVAADVPAPPLVLITVGEADLPPILETLPAAWHDRVGLIQNELLPRDWARYGFEAPTVASVWFEKKQGQDVKVIIPTPVWGPGAPLLVDALGSIGIPGRVVEDANAMRNELVVKNLYILTANIGGLAVGGGTVAELWNDHREIALGVARDAIAVQASLVGEELDEAPLIATMVEAFMADPEHKAMGRSAPARLERAIAHGDEAGLALPALRAIARG